MRQIECTQLFPPELSDGDYVDMSSDKEFEHASWVYLNSIRAKEEALEEEKWAKDMMIKKAKGNAKNEYITLTKHVHKGAIDYDKIPELQNIDIEKYRNPDFETYSIIQVK